MYNIKHGATEDKPASQLPVKGPYPTLQQGMQAGLQVAD
jgi:hypothetical protein